MIPVFILQVPTQTTQFALEMYGCSGGNSFFFLRIRFHTQMSAAQFMFRELFLLTEKKNVFFKRTSIAKRILSFDK